MSDLLKEVRTTKHVRNNISKFETLSLDENKISHKKQGKALKSIIEIESATLEELPLRTSSGQDLTVSSPHKPRRSAEPERHKRRDSTIFLHHAYLTESVPASLVDDAREILRSQPCHEDLRAVLEYLQYGIDGRHDFDVRVTSPKSAQIADVLVTTTIPDVWTNLGQKELSEDELQMKKTIISSLSSATGLGALLVQIRQSQSQRSPDGNKAQLTDMISVLSGILKSSKTVSNFISDARKLYIKETQRRLFWQELTTLLAGGRILSVVAEVFATGKIDGADSQFSWLSNGADYSRWLAKNICTAATKLPVADTESWGFLTQLLKRAFNLGQRELLISEIYQSLLLGESALWTPLHQLLRALSPHEQKMMFDTILHDLSKRYLSNPAILGFSDDEPSRKAVSGAAALVSGLVKHNELLEQYLEEWLVVVNASYASVGLATRRALIAVLAQSEGKLELVLDRALSTFADKIQMQHGLMLQQEAVAQSILLALGCLQRIDPSIIGNTSIQSLIMRSVSNRLAASVPRARFLGMVVGIAISKIVDEPGKVLDFGVEEMETDEAVEWLRLPGYEDSVGSIEILRRSLPVKSGTQRSLRSSKTRTKAIKKQQPSHTSKIIAIEEVSDSSEEEDPELVPYTKPDSDPDDSDDDPTLINRSKPSAPVYIVDLIKYLGKSEEPGLVDLALRSAPSLIRRKAAFGSEVADNVHNLATSLINLQEGVSDAQLRRLRLESLIACVVAKPEEIAPSFSTLYFEGDFSISQRVTILTAIGLGARELAGFKDENASSSSEADMFPSKRLPSYLEPSTSSQPADQVNSPISAITNSAAQSILRPMALAAADKMTGPSVLKIRTFSSRMEVQKRNHQKQQARTKIIPKNLHNLLTKSFYLPLCCRMTLLLSLAGGRNLNTTILQSSLVRMFLQTLTLILHTLGPSASLHLPTLTHETLSLLTSLLALSTLSIDPLVLPAILHLLLGLIDVTIEAGTTAQERLITEHGNQVAELVSWANSLGERFSVPDVIGQGGGEEEEGGGGMPWTVLAAGIQVKWFEMGQRFQGRMLGLMSDELNGL